MLSGDPGLEDLLGRPPFHAAAAVGLTGVVGLKIRIQVLLHLLDGLVPGGPPLDAEMLFEERAVEALDEAVGLGPPHLGRAVLDVLQLQEELVGMLVRPAAVLAPVVAQDRLHLDAVLLEEGQHVVVQDLDRGHRHLARVEPGPDVAAEAVSSNCRF